MNSFVPLKKVGIYVAQFANGRDNGFRVDPDDTDGDRVKLIVETARKKNPSINILVSLGWGPADNDTGKAAMTPVPFADSVRTLIQAYDLDGFDIDFEYVTTNTAAMLTLATEIRRSLDKIASKRPKIMTITPADTDGLDADVLKMFTYVMPQTYGHGGNGTTATWYGQQLGSYSRLVYGLNSETPSDDPKTYLKNINSNHAAGMFAWRLDNDSSRGGLPTFATASEMWKLLHPAAVGA